MIRHYLAVLSTSVTLAGSFGQELTSATQPGSEPTAVMARQGSLQLTLGEHVQSVMFLKSNETDPKAAVANLLITQVGLPLITMGLSTQMRMWNPYMGETFTKAANLGKGILSGHGTDTRGFEYEMIPGLTGSVTLKEGATEFLIPLNRYTGPDVDAAGLQPTLVRLETRDKDQARLISARRVLLKENKKGRFDLNPTVERQESDVQQHVVPSDVRREEGNLYRITPNEPLQAGEYAILLRKKSDSGEYSSNVALKPVSPEVGQHAASAQAAPVQKSRFAGMMKRPASPMSLNPLSMNPMQQEQPQQQITGFLAWDFRVSAN